MEGVYEYSDHIKMESFSSMKIQSTCSPRWRQIFNKWNKKFLKQKKNWYNIGVYQELPAPPDNTLISDEGHDIFSIHRRTLPD